MSGEDGRARQRDLVRRGYDAISTAYRSDDGESNPASAEDTARYAGWVEELAEVLPPPATVIDLGCGAGVPGTRLLSDAATGRSGSTFPACSCSAPTVWCRARPSSRPMWRASCSDRAPMFWDHVDAATYLEWFDQAGLRPVWSRFIPEGGSGHTLVLARAVD